MNAKPSIYAQSFPALTGDVVTQGHTDYCKKNGHAKHTVAGVDQGYCPRCGEVTATTRTSPKVSHMLPKSRPGFAFTPLFVSYVGSGNFHESTEWEIILLGSEDTTEEGAKGRAISEASKHIYAELDKAEVDEVVEVVIEAEENNPARPITVAVSPLHTGKAYKVRFTTRQFWV